MVGFSTEVWSFEITDPYISAITPNGGEVWKIGNTEIIRWETNLLEKVRIDLLQDQSFLLAIDTIPGNHQAYEWQMSGDLPKGDNFSIQISSESNPAILGISENVFTINDTLTAIQESGNPGSSEYSLSQNFPNPFTLVTEIPYTIQSSDYVTLSVYNLIGEKVHTLIHEYQEAGSYTANFNAQRLPAGIYFYKLQIGDDFAEIKKMILAK
ncbi:MAG: T9SS type A sorting domain-containing protein [Deltaproteobacteria bacterium]|nr:T9SS type A sorting domain-containing protein [Deltaproteobacteria bacterium]